MVIIDIVINTLLGRVTQHPAGMHVLDGTTLLFLVYERISRTIAGMWRRPNSRCPRMSMDEDINFDASASR